MTDLQSTGRLQHDASLTIRNWQRGSYIAPTCLRRVKRLRDAGLIERQIAVLSTEKIADVLGHGLTCHRGDHAGPAGRPSTGCF
jgi:Lrp/AsnC family leucine-responsive transcriptional regulator